MEQRKQLQVHLSYFEANFFADACFRNKEIK